MNSFAENEKVVFFGTSTKTLEVPFGEPTVLKFEKRVKSYSTAKNYMIKAEDENDPDYTTLVIVPKFTSGREKVSFVLEDRKIARIKFKTKVNDSSTFKETTYIFKSKTYSNPSKAPVIGEVDLLKAMVKDSQVSGFKRKKVSKSVNFKQRGVSSRLVRTYEGRNMNGYVFKLTNHLKKNNVYIDVRNVTFGSPDLAVLSQSDHSVLYPKNNGTYETFLRVVTEPSSNYKNTKLPMTTAKLKDGGKK